MFATEQEKALERLIKLETVLDGLREQRDSLGEDNGVLHNSYTIAMCHLLVSIKGLAERIVGGNDTGCKNENES